MQDKLGITGPLHFPGYSPCNHIVGWLRSCYWAKVRWYRGGGFGVIRYHFVPETNPYMDHPGIWFGESQLPEMRANGREAGERYCTPTVWYSGANAECQLGPVVGTDDDFRGEGIKPKNDTNYSIVPCRCPLIGDGGIDWGGAGNFSAGFAGEGGIDLGGAGNFLAGAFVGTGGMELDGEGKFLPLVSEAGIEVGGGGNFAAGLPGDGGIEVGGAGQFWWAALADGGIEVGGGGNFAAGLAGDGGIEVGGAGAFPLPMLSDGGIEVGGGGNFAAGLAGDGGSEVGGSGDFP